MLVSLVIKMRSELLQGEMQIVTMHDTDCTNPNLDSTLRPGFWNKLFDLTCLHFFIQTGNTWCWLSLSSAVFCHLATALLVWWCVFLSVCVVCVRIRVCICCVCYAYNYMCMCVSACVMCVSLWMCVVCVSLRVCGRRCCNLGGLRHRLAVSFSINNLTYLELWTSYHGSSFCNLCLCIRLKRNSPTYMRWGTTTTTTLLRC